MAKRFILITSPPACGKTRLAKRLATALDDTVYLDKDTLIVLSKQIFKVAGEPYNRSSDFFQKNIRDYEYAAIIDLGLEAIKYSSNVIINAPFTQELRNKRFIEDFKTRLSKLDAKLLVVYISATPELCKFRMKKRNSDRDKWKIEHWDEYIKGVNFTVPDIDEDELFVHKNSNDVEADEHFERLIKKVKDIK
ncbi:MAG: ATP-binding protein [Clostridia bacterium]|nr:ATP-binding protein [Clostridia bacterium]